MGTEPLVQLSPMRTEPVKLKFHYADFSETSPCHGRGSRPSATYGKVTEMFHRDFKLSRLDATCRNGMKNSRDKSAVELRTSSLSSQTFAKKTQKSFIRLLAPLKTFV